jgi:ribosomal protein L1
MSDTNDTVVVSSYQGGPSELDNLAETFIKQTADKFQEEINAEWARPESPAPQEAENTVAAPETPAAPESKPEERGIERLVEREVALRSREAELVAREARYAEIESRMKAMESRVVPEDLRNQFEYAPEEALKAMGVDPEMLVRQVIANRLGPNAPPDVKQTIESAQIKKQINDLKSELFNYQRQAAAAQFVAQVQEGAREYVSKGLSENVPTVAALAKSNPDRVYREILEVIATDANQKAARGQGGDVLTYEEAAKQVEAKWSEYKNFFSAPTSAPSTPASTTQAPTTAPKPQTPVATKPPDRPIAPWLQKVEIEEEGIRAAMDAYRKANNKP